MRKEERWRVAAENGKWGLALGRIKYKKSGRSILKICII